MMALSSMAGLCASSQYLLSGNLQIRRGFKGLAYSPELRSPVIRAQQMQKPESEVSVKNRRAVIGLLASGFSAGLFIDNVLANGIPIKIGPPPPPSGGLAGTRNSDEARDLDLPLKERFYLQPLSPSLAAERAKESAKDIVKVKELIDRKAWPYVMNDLRTKANYLRFDLKTVISAKPKEEKKELKDLTSKLFASIDGLDHAAKTKSSSQADKYYSDTVAVLNDVLAKI